MFIKVNSLACFKVMHIKHTCGMLNNITEGQQFSCRSHIKPSFRSIVYLLPREISPKTLYRTMARASKKAPNRGYLMYDFKT